MGTLHATGFELSKAFQACDAVWQDRPWEDLNPGLGLAFNIPDVEFGSYESAVFDIDNHVTDTWPEDIGQSLNLPHSNLLEVSKDASVPLSCIDLPSATQNENIAQQSATAPFTKEEENVWETYLLSATQAELSSCSDKATACSKEVSFNSSQSTLNHGSYFEASTDQMQTGLSGAAPPSAHEQLVPSQSETRSVCPATYEQQGVASMPQPIPIANPPGTEPTVKVEVVAPTVPSLPYAYPCSSLPFEASSRFEACQFWYGNLPISQSLADAPVVPDIYRTQSMPVFNCAAVHVPDTADRGGSLPLKVLAPGVPSVVSRQKCLERYREKKLKRLFTKKIRYHMRKINADKRPRIKGRFVKACELEEYMRAQPIDELGLLNDDLDLDISE